MARRRFDVREDMLDNLNNAELIERYRLDRESILFLSDYLHVQLTPKTRRNHSLSPLEKVLVGLQYMASPIFQIHDAGLHKISQPTVSRTVTQFVDALSSPEVVAHFIKFPTERNEIRQTKEDFYNIARFPNVIGAIDGTQIQIQAPSEEEATYVNRHGYHSINCQVRLKSKLQYRI